MGLLSTLFGGLMGGGGQSNQADWKQIEKLMQLSAELNRYNTEGIFGGSEWTEAPDGSWTQSRTVNAGMQPGIDRLMSRGSMGTGMEPYQSPPQFAQLMDAAIGNQMDRRGMQHGGWESFQNAQRPGRFPSMFDIENPNLPQAEPPPPPPLEGGNQGDPFLNKQGRGIA